ncbi:hypothetical protein Moror_10079 [Moniliophthora roreri MCA 2997]|uniref:Uncharacterized protein n=1 Tax=Moniliophthora roreri (strain MCA 2997) TaxID=1381753 RepID=V2WVA0_MONRO|nr:hypothetical protein Moror_10079 [Moniliophthora roreri MCA 2997]
MKLGQKNSTSTLLLLHCLAFLSSAGAAVIKTSVRSEGSLAQEETRFSGPHRRFPIHSRPSHSPHVHDLASHKHYARLHQILSRDLEDDEDTQLGGLGRGGSSRKSIYGSIDVMSDDKPLAYMYYDPKTNTPDVDIRVDIATGFTLKNLVQSPNDPSKYQGNIVYEQSSGDRCLTLSQARSTKARSASLQNCYPQAQTQSTETQLVEVDKGGRFIWGYCRNSLKPESVEEVLADELVSLQDSLQDESPSSSDTLSNTARTTSLPNSTVSESFSRRGDASQLESSPSGGCQFVKIPESEFMDIYSWIFRKAEMR